MRPAHPHFLSEQGELGPHLTHPALGGKAGALGVAGQERVKGPEGASGVGSTLGCGFPPGQEAKTWECSGRGQLSADTAIFLLAGTAEPGQGPRD